MPSWKKLISSGSNAHLNAVTASSDIVISQDSKKLMLGAGNDLQIYHDGSNNYIDSTTSDQDLYIRGNDGGSMITAARFDMSDAGTLLPGNNLRMGDSKKIRLGTANDFNLYHDGSDSYIYNESSAGKIIIQNTTSDGDIEIKVNDGGSTTNAIVIDASDNARVKLANDNQKLSIGASNDLELFHDSAHTWIENKTGNLLIRNQSHGSKLQFGTEDSSGTLQYVLNITGDNHRVGIGTSSPSYLLHLSGTAPELAFQDTDGSAIWRARSVTNNFHITETGAGDPFIIESGAGANLLVLDSNQRVGIGTSGPGEKLHVDGSIEFAGRKYNRGIVSVAGAGTANGQAITLSTGLGTTLNVNYQYKITLNTIGTGTDTGAVYILTYDQDGGAWDLHLVSRNGSTSNHPLAVVDGSNLKAYHNHASTYSILYFVEFWDMSADDGTLHGWGADYQCTRDVDTLSYSAGDVNIDSGAFFVDASTNRVGLLDTSPDATLQIGSGTDGTLFYTD